jgi:uncharacterized repeat protein (TIGR01451 family)
VTAGNPVTSVSWNLGAEPAGATVTLLFRTTISAQLPANANVITNQATWTATGEPGGSSNPVVANVAAPPASGLTKVQRDVTTAGSFSPAPLTASPSDILEYRLIYSNTGSGPASAVVISDPMPANANFVAGSCNPVCTTAGNPVTGVSWSLGTQAAGVNVILIFRVSVNAQLPASSNVISNQAAWTVTAEAGGTSNTVVTNVAAAPTSGLVKAERDVTAAGSFSAGPITASPGDTLEYQLTYHNGGSGPAAGVVVSDAIPSNTSFVAVSCNPACTTTGNPVTSVSWNLGAEPAGVTVALVFRATVNGQLPASSNAISNQATWTATAEGGGSSNTVVANVAATATSGVTKAERDATTVGAFSAGPITANPGDTLEYQLTYHNGGSGPAAGVVVADAIPANSTFVAASCNPVCVTTGNPVTSVSWTLGAEPAGATATVLFRTTVASRLPAASNAISNHATLTATAEAAGGSNTVIANVAATPASAVTKAQRDVTTAGAFSAAPITANPGDTLEYQLTYHNGGSGPASGVVVADGLPANTTFVVASCNPACVTTGNPVTSVSWALGSQPAGVTVALTFEATVNAQLPAGSNAISNQAAVTATGEPGGTSNTVVASVGAAPTSTLAKAERDVTTAGAFIAGPITANPGDTLEYQLAYHNGGSGPASGVVVTDAMPGNTTFVVASCNPVCTTTGNPVTSVSWNLGAEPAGSTVTLLFQVSVAGRLPAASNVISNTATWTATGEQGGSSNTAVANVAAAPTSAVSKAERDVTAAAAFSAGPIPASPSDIVEYQLTYQNGGSGPASGVVVTDAIPANTTLVPASCNPACLTIGAPVTSVHWNLGAEPAGATVTLVFRVTLDSVFPPGVTPVLNQASLTATSEAGGQSNSTIANVNAAPRSRVAKAERDLTAAGSFAAGPIAAAPSDTVEYQLTYTNSGQAAAAGVTVTDVVPQHSTFVSCTGGCVTGGTAPGSSITWAVGAQPAGASVTVSFRVALDPSFPAGQTAVSNQAAVTATGEANQPSNTVVANVIAAAGSGVAKTERDLTTAGTFTVGPITANTGDTLEYRLTYHNSGNAPATNVVLTDPVPSFSTYVSCAGGCATAGNPVTSVSWSLGTVAAGGNATVTFQVHLASVFAAGTTQVTNQATVTAADESSAQSNPVSASVTAAPSSGVTKAERNVTAAGSFAAGPIAAQPGDTLEYRLTYDNVSNANASGVVVTDPIPAGTTLVAASCVPACTTFGNPVTSASWTLGTVAPNSPQAVVFRVTMSANFPAGTTVVTNQASVNATGEQPSPSNSVAASVSAQPNSAVSKAERDVTLGGGFGPGPIVAGHGDVIEYQLTYTNGGNADAAGVSLTDQVPLRSTFASCTGGCSGGAGPGSTVTWALGTVAHGAAVTATFRTQLDAVFPIGVTPVNNQAAVSATGEASKASNTVTANVTVPLVDLSIVATHQGSFVAGNTGVVTLSATNNDSVYAANNPTIVETLPAGLTFLSAQAPPGVTCSAVGQVVTCQDAAPLGPGASLILNFTVVIDQSAVPSVINTGTVASSTADPNLVNNRSTDVIPVGLVDLAIQKQLNGGQLTAGQDATYTLTVTNVGNATTFGPVTVSDALPSGLSFVSATGAGWSCAASGGVVTCTLAGNMSPGDTRTISLVVAVSGGASGSITNRGTVSTHGDFNSSNDSASTSAPVVVPPPPMLPRAGMPPSQPAGPGPGLLVLGVVMALLAVALGLAQPTRRPRRR